MRAFWIIGATIAAFVATTMVRDEDRNKLPQWVLKLLGR
jgi:hypothetical protein